MSTIEELLERKSSDSGGYRGFDFHNIKIQTSS
jgi:hypothetical protein